MDVSQLYYEFAEELGRDVIYEPNAEDWFFEYAVSKTPLLLFRCVKKCALKMSVKIGWLFYSPNKHNAFLHWMRYCDW